MPNEKRAAGRPGTHGLRRRILGQGRAPGEDGGQRQHDHRQDAEEHERVAPADLIDQRRSTGGQMVPAM